MSQEERRRINIDLDISDVKDKMATMSESIAVIKEHVISCAEAKKQVYKNEKEIIRLKGFQKLATWLGGTVIFATIITTVKGLLTHFTKH